MERCNGPTLDACNEDSVGVVLVLLHKISRSLLGGNGDKWYSLICWLEPDNLWLVLVALGLLTTMRTILGLALGVLLLLGCLTTWSK